MYKLRPYQSELVDATFNAWQNGYTAPCIVLPCGGGKSIIVAEIAKRIIENGDNILFLVHRRELVAQIYATFVRFGISIERCQIAMVQTVCRHLEKIPKPTLIITDENHHSKATSYRKVYEHFSNVPRVGVTATPVRLDGTGLADVNDKLIIGVSAKWLIENKCLAPYDYYAPPISTNKPKFHTRNGEFVASEILAFYDKPAIYGDIVKHYQKLANGKQAIAYCTAITQSEKLCKEFVSKGVTAVHIDAKTPHNERKSIIEQFRQGEIKILSNVDLISEGFDVPDCEVSILARPTQSLTLYIQQSMRCMRYKPDKRAIIIDHAGNWERFGLPDDDREWTLEGKQKKKQAGESVVKTCPQCFNVIAGATRICSRCGYEFKFEGLQEKIKTELVKIDEQKQLECKVRNFLTPADCQNMKELQEYARQKGYKPGWAYYQAKSRGFLGGSKQGNKDTKRYPCRAIQSWNSGA